MTRPYEQLTDAGKSRRHRATAKAALEHYGLGDAEIRQLAVDTNFVYRVTAADGRRFALRVQRGGLHSPRETELELWWVQRLGADGVPVAAAVPNQASELVTTIDGIAGVPGAHRCVLFDWLPGGAPDDNEMSYWRAMGELAARLHRHSVDLAWPAHLSVRRWDSVFPYEAPVIFDPAHARVVTPAMREVLEAGIATLDLDLAARYDDGRAVQLLHGDLHDENVRSFRGNLSVFDFEDVIVGMPEHDLAVLLYGPYYNRDDFDDVAASVRAGYEAVAAWPIADTSALTPLFTARALGLVNFCLSVGPDYDHYIAMLVDRVQRWLQR